MSIVSLRKSFILLAVLAVMFSAALVAVSSSQTAKAVGGGVLYNNSSTWLSVRDERSGTWFSVAPGASSGSKSSDINSIWVGTPGACVQFRSSSDGSTWGRWTNSYYNYYRSVNNQMVQARNC